MRRWKVICMSLLIFSLILLANSQTAFAAEEEYTYTVRLYTGNIGALTGRGIEISSSQASISSGGDCAVISGLKYGDMVYIRPQDAANVTDERYYVKGVRRSGRDNEEAESPTFYVACDRDYVVAYGVKGNMAAYTVNYQDTEGKTLLQSDTYYGNIGERQYVASRYIEGYQPTTLNMVKTLSANAAENVFTFQYVKVVSNETAEPGNGTGGTSSTVTTTTSSTGGTGTTNNNGTTNADDDAEADEESVEEAALGGDAALILPDEEVPLAQQNLEDLDDGEVPLANIKLDQAGTIMGYLPVYIGIGATAVLLLLIAAIYLSRRRKALAKKSKGKADGRVAGLKK